MDNSLQPLSFTEKTVYFLIGCFGNVLVFLVFLQLSLLAGGIEPIVGIIGSMIVKKRLTNAPPAWKHILNGVLVSCIALVVLSIMAYFAFTWAIDLEGFQP